MQFISCWEHYLVSYCLIATMQEDRGYIRTDWGLGLQTVNGTTGLIFDLKFMANLNCEGTQILVIKVVATCNLVLQHHA